MKNLILLGITVIFLCALSSCKAFDNLAQACQEYCAKSMIDIYFSEPIDRPFSISLKSLTNREMTVVCDVGNERDCVYRKNTSPQKDNERADFIGLYGFSEKNTEEEKDVVFILKKKNGEIIEKK